jgi:hypothetical protein
MKQTTRPADYYSERRVDALASVVGHLVMIEQLVPGPARRASLRDTRESIKINSTQKLSVPVIINSCGVSFTQSAH